MKLILSLFAAALVAGTLSAADATTSATKPHKEKAARPGAGAMSGMMDLRKALSEDETKALREVESKVKALAEACKKDASEVNVKALKDQLAAAYDARLAAFQKVVDRTTDATEKAKYAAVVKTMTDNKDAHLQKAYEMATMERPQMPKGEKKNKK
ncbi:MAG: hypothetical protein AB7F32_04890 [Victivallaceae bacterium]